MKLVIFVILLFFMSCGQDITSTGRTRGSTTQNFSGLTCSCGDQSAPVCAFTGTQYVTFLNGCIAQCNGFAYTSGSCTPTTNCNQNSGQVCGQPPMPECPQGLACTQAMPNPEWYANECDLVSAKATVVDDSYCSSP